VSQDEVPFLQLDGFASVSAAQVGHSATVYVSVSDPVPSLPEQGACMGAPGIHVESSGQTTRTET
jgi:hypothetical protein